MRLSMLLCSLAIALACDADAKSAEPTTRTDDAQLPPEGHAALGPWLAAGHYKSWACEPEPHASRPPGAHGRTRICSNDALAAASGDDPYPVGAAAVKELRRGADDDIGGYAIYRKVGASDKGAGWYWYEVIGTSVVADGRGDKGDAKDVCVSCHEDAPRDFVFTHVTR